MAGLGSTDSLPSFEKELQFFQKWDLPQSDSDFPTQVLAVADYVPSLNKKQVQFIYDYCKQRLGDSEIKLDDLLNECDQYEKRLPFFLKDLSENSSAHLPGAGASSTSFDSPLLPAADTVETDSESLPPNKCGAETFDEDIVDGNFTKTASKLASKVGQKLSKVKKPDSTSSKHHTSTGNEMFDMIYLQKELTVLQEEHRLLEDNRKCVGCKERNRDIVFLPCGHFLMCKICAEPVYSCSKCMTDVLATAQTYLS